MKNKEKEGDFNCRICGHNKYEEVRKSNEIFDPGGHSWVEYYFCNGCGVIFLNPKMFFVLKPQTKEE